ncbi:rCG64247 [Rattus norvegicus]|uniref:RCG64247 n=1 Tax=Rattus norvegicus TaxID=10116 RepID=A6JZ15_RAT|nr:rCG64247 [Rattus norvegicus]
MNHIKRARMSLSISDYTNSSKVSISSHNTQVPSVELDEVSYFACFQINLNGVIHLDERIRVSNSTSIMGHQKRDSFCAHKDLSHFAQLVLSLSGVIL